MANDIILGQVQSIDWQDGLMIVTPEKPETPSMSVKFDPHRMKDQLSVGKWVRIWGDYHQGSSSYFHARRIHHINKNASPSPCDLSGVRKRIKQMHKRMHKQRFNHKRPSGRKMRK